MSRKLNAAVIGAGMMGRNHVRVWNEMADVNLVAVCDPHVATLEAAINGTQARGYAAPAAMFAEEQIDLVSVVVPTTLHLPMTLAALAAGAHVLVEKPIASDRAEAESMMAAAEAAGRILTVGHIERFNPAIRELRSRLDAGELGRIFQVVCTRLGPFPPRIRDTGVVVDLATHDIDMLRHLLGADPVRLYAETERRIHTAHEDLFLGLVKFDGGAVGMLNVNWLTPTKQRTVTVTGERGMFIADYIAQSLTFYPNAAAETWAQTESGSAINAISEGEVRQLAIPRAEPLAVELGEFAAAVRDGGVAPVSPRDGMLALLLARALVASGQAEQIATAELAEVLR